ncbi:hypothetical protein ACFLWA_13465 [Chloroflexota bacterium]
MKRVWTITFLFVIAHLWPVWVGGSGDVAPAAERHAPGERLVNLALCAIDGTGQGVLADCALKARRGIRRKGLDVERDRLGLQGRARAKKAAGRGQAGRLDGHWSNQ